MREENQEGSIGDDEDRRLTNATTACVSHGHTKPIGNTRVDGNTEANADEEQDQSTPEGLATAAMVPDAPAGATEAAAISAKKEKQADNEGENPANTMHLVERTTGDSAAGAEVPLSAHENPAEEPCRIGVGGDQSKAQSEEKGSTTMVLRDGRVMAPAFQTGEVLCHDISTTSVRVTWPHFSDKKYPVYAYRVCTAEVGCGFEVTYGAAPPHKNEAVIVGLKPGKAYQFHVASVSGERMLVPGSSIVSIPVKLPEAEYERAWFFEGVEEDIKWTAFEGLGPDSVGPTGGGGGGAGGTSAALDDIRCCFSPTRCYTGLKSLCLTVPPGLAGGVYVDTPVKEGWLYVVKAKIYHEREDATQALAGPGSAGATGRKGSKMAVRMSWVAGRKESKSTAVTTRLMLWDMLDVKEMSAPAVKTGEWEALECQIVPFRSEHLRITIQSEGEGNDTIFVDAVELFHGGPTPAERAVSSIVGFMDKPRSMPSKVLIHLESARNVRAADAIGTSDPFIKVFVGNTEVHRTKVIPMTLSPVWDEAFFISPEPPTKDATAHADGSGVRFEIWDHDLHGEGDYLGEVCFANDELKAAPPHRTEHKAIRHPARSGDSGDAAAAAAAPNTPATRHKNHTRNRARAKRGRGGGGGMGAGGPPTSLALAVQVSWPEDPESAEGKLVRNLQDEQGLLPTRANALKELSLAALREPRNIEDAAKAKEVLLRARAAEAAVWVLSDPDFLEDACRLLVGLVKLNAAAAGTEAGFALCRKLRLFVLQLSPAVVAVRCLRGKIGPPEVLLELLAKLYVGQQAALHEDAVEIQGFFYSLVLHIDTSAPAQALVREISGGAREFSPRLLELFRRYRTRIPTLPGLWRTSVLQQLSAEEAHPPDADRDDFEANEEDADDPHLFHGKNSRNPNHGGRGEPSLLELVRGNLTVALIVVPPLFKAVVGAKRVGTSKDGGSCEQPVGTMILLDGLLLMCAALGGGCFRVNRQRFSALAGTWLFPCLFMAFLLHLGLVLGLLVSLAKVNTVEAGGGQDLDDGKVACSSGTFAWGVLFLVVDLFCLVAPPVVWCVRCYDRVTRSTPAAAASTFVVPDEGNGRDTRPVGKAV